MNVGKSIRMALVKREKTQKWLQEQMGYKHPQQASQLANCKTTKGATLEKVAAIFDMSVSELLELGER